MSSNLITSTHWLEPLLPENVPASLLAQADRMTFDAGHLSGCLAPETAIRLGRLLRVTSSFYSNLIEGQFTEPLSLSPNSVRRSPKQLKELAASHLAVQARYERLLKRLPDMPWCELFSPRLIARLHKHLFEGAREDELRLQDGSLMSRGIYVTRPKSTSKWGIMQHPTGRQSPPSLNVCTRSMAPWLTHASAYWPHSPFIIAWPRCTLFLRVMVASCAC